jgi:hypothetical protein
MNAQLPGLKESELARLGKCAVCGEPLLPDLTFYKLRMERAVFVADALRRRVGLGLQIGALAAVMGPDEDLAKIVSGPVDVAVHERCAGLVEHLLLLFPEDEQGGSASGEASAGGEAG